MKGIHQFYNKSFLSLKSLSRLSQLNAILFFDGVLRASLTVALRLLQLFSLTERRERMMKWSQTKIFSIEALRFQT
jgi:hypothetical protein